MTSSEEPNAESQEPPEKSGKLVKAVIFLFIAGIIFLNQDNLRDVLFMPTEYAPFHQEGVVLYATDWCGYCKKTRGFFAEKGIEYVEFDIEKSAEGRKQYEQLKGRGVPLVVANGMVIRGYSPRSVLAALNASPLADR